MGQAQRRTCVRGAHAAGFRAGAGAGIAADPAAGCVLAPPCSGSARCASGPACSGAASSCGRVLLTWGHGTCFEDRMLPCTHKGITLRNSCPPPRAQAGRQGTRTSSADTHH